MIWKNQLSFKDHYNFLLDISGEESKFIIPIVDILLKESDVVRSQNHISSLLQCYMRNGKCNNMSERERETEEVRLSCGIKPHYYNHSTKSHKKSMCYYVRSLKDIFSFIPFKLLRQEFVYVETFWLCLLD